jgi:hypothetical protein
MHSSIARASLVVVTTLSVGCFKDSPEAATNGSTTSGSSSDNRPGSETSSDVDDRSTTSDTGLDASGDTTGAGTSSDPSSDTTSGPGTEETGEDTETASCPAATHTCAPHAPPDWNGPVAVAEAPDPAQCPATYPESELTVYADLEAEDAGCSCSCSEATGSTCPPATLQRWAGDEGCPGAPSDEFSVAPGVCEPINSPLGLTGYFGAIAPVGTPAGGSCSPSLETNLPAAYWATTVVGCGGSTPRAGCNEGEACLPRPQGVFQGVCVWREGDEPCPAGYQYKSVHHSEMADTRECIDDCSCGSPTNVSCGGTVELYNQNECGSNNETLTIGGVCLSPSPSLVRGAIYHPEVSGQCLASGGTPTGSVAPQSPVTVCCL